MPDIHHEFPIEATPERVYQAVTTPAGLDAWWTLSSSGEPRVGAEYALCFGPSYDWRARVSKAETPAAFELELVRADPEWQGPRVGFLLTPRDHATTVRFYHTGWPAANEHWRVSSFCWAMYLRILRRHLEHGEVVPYDERLSV